jgi:uncharacterized Zn finger protein
MAQRIDIIATAIYIDYSSYTVAGTTGTLYDVCLNPVQPSCTCPDFANRPVACKHILYIMYRVLNMPRVTEGTQLRQALHTHKDLIPVIAHIMRQPTPATQRATLDVHLQSIVLNWLWEQDRQWQQPRWQAGDTCLWWYLFKRAQTNH